MEMANIGGLQLQTLVFSTCILASPKVIDMIMLSSIHAISYRAPSEDNSTVLPVRLSACPVAYLTRLWLRNHLPRALIYHATYITL